MTAVVFPDRRQSIASVDLPSQKPEVISLSTNSRLAPQLPPHLAQNPSRETEIEEEEVEERREKGKEKEIEKEKEEPEV